MPSPSPTSALADTYVAIQKAAWDVPAVDAPKLEAELARIVREARVCWPGVESDPEAFTSWLAHRAPDETPPLEALAAMHTTDLYLACACAAGDPAAIGLFEAKVLPAVRPAVARIEKDPAFIKEVQDSVRIRLLVDGEAGSARIRSYIGRGPLTSWVQVTAIRAAYSMKRKKPKETPEDMERLVALPIPGDDQELVQIRSEFAPAFRQAFEEALADLSVRERNVLRMQVIEGLSTESIGQMYRVHRATVARWIAAIHQTLLRETKKRLKARLAISPEEFDSLIRLLSSQLEVSIVTVLDAGVL